MSNFIKIVRKIIKLNIYMINDFFIDAKADVINFNRFVILMINVHNHFNFNFLMSFFSFEVFSTIDEKFKIEIFRWFFRWYRDIRVWNIVTLIFNKRNRTKWTSSTLKWNYFVNYFQFANFLLQFFVDLSNVFKLVFQTC